MSKYGVLSGPYFPVFRPEKIPYLDTLHAVLHLQNLADFSVTPVFLNGQNPLNWPETFCRRLLLKPEMFSFAYFFDMYHQ